MIVVSDASSLIGLGAIDYLWILEKQFGELIVPRAVYEEVVIRGKSKPGSKEVEEADWIKIEEVKDREAVNALRSILNPGESEALVLAQEKKANLIILDKKKARILAEKRGVKVTGILALLNQAKERGWIFKVRPLIEKLRAKGFRISDLLYEEILQEAKEI